MGYNHYKNKKIPAVKKGRTGKGAVDEVHLNGGVTEEVKENAGDKHLDHTPASLHGVTDGVVAPVASGAHFKLIAQFVVAGVETFSHDGIQDQLDDHGQVVEQDRLGILVEQVEVDGVVAWKHGLAVFYVWRCGDCAVENDHRQSTEDRRGPDDDDGNNDFLPSAKFVNLQREDNSDESETESKQMHQLIRIISSA